MNVEEQVVALTQEMYKAHNRAFRPLYPWVLVRVLDREQKVGSIYAPDLGQNKPVHEGIVLTTWAPFTKEVGKVNENGVKLTRTIEQHSMFQPGDHVLFHHWAGQPIHGFDDKKYRVIRECDWEASKEGGIFAQIEYGDKSQVPGAALREILCNVLAGIDANEEINMEKLAGIMAAHVEENFVLVPANTKCVTLSGR